MSEDDVEYPLIEEKQFSMSDNVKMSYILSEGAKNLTIVFLHGLGSSKYDFLNAFDYDELNAYNLLIIDFIGHGNSSTLENFPFTIESQAMVVFKLIEHLSLPEDVIILAHSMAGPVAIKLAELLGNRAVGLIYAEGNIDVGDCFLSNNIITTYTFEDWLKDGFKTYVEMLEQDPDSIYYAINFQKAGPVSTYLSSLDVVKISKEGKLLERLVALSIPVLVLFGENNKGKFTSEEKLKGKFPIIYIPNSSHDMMYENPDVFYNSIIDFLSQY
ncbi:MAG: alpha/beta hydrolase [Asgard group archaeon]|nr:alpha/beta hydrolase [Asgard group archaeon]